MEDDYTTNSGTNSHYLSYTILPKRLGECTFWTYECNRLSLSYTFVLVFIFSLVPIWKSTAKQSPVATRTAAVICHGTHQMGLAMQRHEFVAILEHFCSAYRKLLPVVRRQFLPGTLAQRGPSHGVSYDACYEREARPGKKEQREKEERLKVEVWLEWNFTVRG